MTPPDTITILGKCYAVKSSRSMGSDYGDCQSDKCLIRYNPKQNTQQLRDTILHEVFHGVFHESGLSWELEQTGVADLEERVVRRVATLTLDTLSRNPALMAYLFPRERD